jgi:nitroreductase
MPTLLADSSATLTTSDGRRFLTLLASRASVPPRQLVAPGLSPDELTALFAAALSAPSHGGLRNARFVTIPDHRRDALADLFEAAKRAEDPGADEEDIRRARDKAHHAPTLILVIARIYDHQDIPAIEQVASVGAAMGAVLNGAHALGYGAMAVSGGKLRTQAFRAGFDLADYEQALTFIAVGVPSKPLREKHRPAPDEQVSRW